MALSGNDARKKQPAAGEKILYTQTAFGRFFHWSQMFLLGTGIITGIYLGNPIICLIPMRTVRYIHITVNVILSALVLTRIYFAFATGDSRNFTFHRGDGKKLVQLMRYYLFLARDLPYEESKYNIGQRVIYVSWVFAWFFHSITGLILASPAASVSVQAAVYFGGLQTIRFVRYLLAVYFVVTIIVHIYLSITSDPAKLQAMFSGYVRVKDGKPDE